MQSATVPTAPVLVYWPRVFVRSRIKITVAVCSLLIVGKMWLGARPLAPLSVQEPLVAVGWGLLFCGVLLRSWAAGMLIKCETLTTVGPYRLVRHPLYSGSLLMIAGFTCWLGSWFDFAVTMPLALVCFTAAIRAEEAFLSTKFGEAWNSYVATTGMLAPRRLVNPFRDAWSPGRWLRNREYNAWAGTIAGLLALQCWYAWTGN